MHVYAREHLGVGLGALGTELDFAAGDVLAAFFQDDDNIIGGAAAGSGQHRFHRPRTEVVAAAFRGAVHHKSMAAAGFGDKAHAIAAHPAYAAFHGKILFSC